MLEIWKDIEGFEGIYQVSNLGRVKSLSRFSCNGHRLETKILKPISGKSKTSDPRRLYVGLHKDGESRRYSIARLVAQAFILNPNNLPEVNHKDENPLNNVVDNLEWCTRKYNACYGTQSKRGAVKRCKAVLQFSLSGKYIQRFDSIKAANEFLGRSGRSSNIGAVCKGLSSSSGGYIWKYE